MRDESYDEEERWITLGTIAPVAILLVVHTWHEEDGVEVVRIISARAAASREGGTMKKLTKEQKRDVAAIAAKKNSD